MKTMRQLLLETYERRTIIFELVRQQLILRYRRTALGFLWTLINPLLMMSITAAVFSRLFNMDIKTYALYLFAGLIPWNLFTSMLTQSSMAYISNEGLMRKIYIPRLVFPLSISIGTTIDSILAFLSLFILFLIVGSNFSISMMFVPISYLLLYLFGLGISVALSLFTVFFRDLQQVITVSLQALFFLTPVMYRQQDIGGWVGAIVNLNPMTHFIALFRAPLYEHGIPPLENLSVACIWVAISLAIGAISYQKLQSKIIFRL